VPWGVAGDYGGRMSSPDAEHHVDRVKAEKEMVRAHKVDPHQYKSLIELLMPGTA
jgi:hypothetical protein